MCYSRMPMLRFSQFENIYKENHEMFGYPSQFSYVSDTVILCYETQGAFFWAYSGIGILGIDGICILLGAIPFSERMEYHSVYSAPDSRMNRMKGIRLLGIDRIRLLLRKFWREILRGRRHSSSRLRSPPPWVFRFRKEPSFRIWNSVYSFIPKPE